MRRLFRVAFAIVILGLMVGAARWAYGQAPQAQAPQFSNPQQRDPAPTIISGNDIGFRVDRQTTETLGKLTGTLVVRVNGQWVEPQPARAGKFLTTR